MGWRYSPFITTRFGYTGPLDRIELPQKGSADEEGALSPLLDAVRPSSSCTDPLLPPYRLLLRLAHLLGTCLVAQAQHRRHRRQRPVDRSRLERLGLGARSSSGLCRHLSCVSLSLPLRAQELWSGALTSRELRLQIRPSATRCATTLARLCGRSCVSSRLSLPSSSCRASLSVRLCERSRCAAMLTCQISTTAAFTSRTGRPAACPRASASLSPSSTTRGRSLPASPLSCSRTSSTTACGSPGSSGPAKASTSSSERLFSFASSSRGQVPSRSSRRA